MALYYVSEIDESGIGWHTPFTPYYLWRKPGEKAWRIVEKELNTISCMSEGYDYEPYRYRIL